MQTCHFILLAAVPSADPVSTQMLQISSINRRSKPLEAMPWCLTLLQASWVQQHGHLLAAVPDGIVIVLLLQVDLPHISPLIMHSHLIKPVPCSTGPLSHKDTMHI